MAGVFWPKPIKTRPETTLNEEDVDQEPFSPASRLFHTPQVTCNVISVIGCKTKINVEVIKEGLKRTWIKHPRMSSKLIFDPEEPLKPVGWVRTKVNVDDHIIVPYLDQNMSSSDDILDDYMSDLTRTSLDLSKPLWEIHILNIKTSKANALAFLRYHHSLGDGVSILSLVLACTRQTANPEALPTLPKSKKWKLFPTYSSYSLSSYFFFLVFMLKILWNTLIDLSLFTATMLWLKDTDTAIKATPGTERPVKRFVHRTMSLEEIKTVKDGLNVTINDVMLGLTQAGLSYYLNRKYGEARSKGKEQNDSLPKHIRLRSLLIMNLRPVLTIKEIAENMEADFKGRWEWGNEIGYVLLPFHISLRSDPLDYIRDAKATIDKKKQSLEAQCSFAFAKILLKVLGLQVTASLVHKILSNTTMCFSNLMYPKEEISFYGHSMVYVGSTVYGHPQALTVHFQSYMDKMTMVVAVDEDVIPDPHKLCDDIEEALKLSKMALNDKQQLIQH